MPVCLSHSLRTQGTLHLPNGTFPVEVILVTKLLFQVVTQSRHPLTSLVWSKYRPKVKQNNLKCLVNILSCQRLVGVVTL